MSKVVKKATSAPKSASDTFSLSVEVLRGLAMALRDMPIDSAVKVLENVEQHLPRIAEVVRDMVRSMRAMPMVEMLKLLAAMDAPSGPARKTGGRAKKASSSAASRPALVLQGRYMGMLRGFGDERTQSMIKAIAKKNGIAAAIRKMESLRRAKKGKS